MVRRLVELWKFGLGDVVRNLLLPFRDNGISITPHCLCLSKENVEAVGLFILFLAIPHAVKWKQIYCKLTHSRVGTFERGPVST